ncbi:hypothetical protein L873DRAFT_1828621 [Choiromyces venosus 120613-1]|uniref:PRP1 splicing factor N-terminal domain-containing protein n=1 Tax=Choiromyces venosus 120613-1 TaxID=1336337 RepID=A0A3N4JQ59_9PEZI|nr:hypothetical protein L873DRAFT_1828621 [Choiromyces venosus 120613-1]
MMKHNFLSQPAPANLVAGLGCDKADRIYQSVDEKMEKRRKPRREAHKKAEREEYEHKNPEIQHQLETLIDHNWTNLPEVRARQATRASGSHFETSIQDKGTSTVCASTEDGTMTNFGDIGKAKAKVLAARLDRSGNTYLKSYITSHNHRTAQTEQGVHGIERVRELLQSVIKINPKHRLDGIAAAPLEEIASKMVQAQSLIARGCKHCPKNEDIWLEAMHLIEPANAEIIVADAMKAIGLGTELWVKKRVLRKAPDIIPHSVVIPTTRLQEQQGNANKINVMKPGIQVLAWVEAMSSHENRMKDGKVKACQAFIWETLGWQLEEGGKKIWIDDAELYTSRVKYTTARIYTCTLSVFWVKKSIWSLYKILGKALEASPQSHALWMMLAKEKWQAGDMNGARIICGKAFNQNPTTKTSDLLLTLPAQNSLLLPDARREAGTDRVLLKPVVFKRHTAQAKMLMAKALKECPHSGLLWEESIWYLEWRTHGRPCLVEAIEEVSNELIPYAGIAQNILVERKLSREINWFQNAILVDLDCGDMWGWYWRFLSMHRTAEKWGEGEVWQRVAKHPGTRYRNSEEMLEAGG